jgi:His-Xaa-Ser system protein HxsD
MTQIRFDKNLYPQEALMKAVYSFTNIAYIQVGQNDKEYIVMLSVKGNDNNIDEIVNQLKNELLAESIRYYISRKTKNLRELILARAFATTIVGNPSADEIQEETENTAINGILTNWFENK